MLKDEIIVLFGVVVMMHLALGVVVSCNDCALGVVVVMNILFNKFNKKRARVKIKRRVERESGVCSSEVCVGSNS